MRVREGKYDEAAESFLSLFTRPADRESVVKNATISAMDYVILTALKKNAEAGIDEKMYVYRFDAEIPGRDNPGAFHSVDLWFFFETLAKCRRPFTGKHYDLACNMCDYRCNFNKTGDPNGPDSRGNMLPEWRGMTADTYEWMKFSDEPRLEKRPVSELEEFLLNHFREEI